MLNDIINSCWSACIEKDPLGGDEQRQSRILSCSQLLQIVYGRCYYLKSCNLWTYSLCRSPWGAASSDVPTGSVSQYFYDMRSHGYQRKLFHTHSPASVILQKIFGRQRIISHTNWSNECFGFHWSHLSISFEKINLDYLPFGEANMDGIY
jgi:hypothetical protein